MSDLYTSANKITGSISDDKKVVTLGFCQSDQGNRDRFRIQIEVPMILVLSLMGKLQNLTSSGSIEFSITESDS